MEAVCSESKQCACVSHWRFGLGTPLLHAVLPGRAGSAGQVPTRLGVQAHHAARGGLPSETLLRTLSGEMATAAVTLEFKRFKIFFPPLAAR